jgi:hypothetical protein
MLILGIESSCDETGAAIIKGKTKAEKVELLSNAVASSLVMHSKTGGIIPENAAREQVKYIIPVVKEALDQAKLNITDLDAISVTYGPGLIGSLLIGVETAKAIAHEIGIEGGALLDIWNNDLRKFRICLGNVNTLCTINTINKSKSISIVRSIKIKQFY